MRIQSIRTISGPNVFHHRPVLMMMLDLEDMAEVSSETIPGFIDRLLALLPGLSEHRCSKGYAGGFVERLHTGTYFAHIIEHIALELSESAGIGVGYGKSIYGGRTGLYKVIVRYRAEEGMKRTLETAVQIAQALALNQTLGFQLDDRIEEIREIVGDTELGPSTRAIVTAAEKKGIPWSRRNDMNLVQLGYGKYRRMIQAAVTDQTSMIAGEIASDKELTKKLLRDASISVPAGEVVSTEEDAILAFKDLRVPVVIKPLDARQGKGVSIGLHYEGEVRKAYQLAAEHSNYILVEELFIGRDFRAVVVGGKLIAIAERIPAHVIGDGKSSIQELIDRENKNPLRGEGHGYPLTRIRIDEQGQTYLDRKGIKLSDIPPAGEQVFLRETANLSTGGTAKDVTDEAHPEIKLMCERAARVVGLDICGIDLILKDISRPILPNEPAGIIEVNAGPGLRMHHFPSEGKPRDVGAAIVEMMFPGSSPSRVPIVSITGTNGKTTVTRMIGHIMAHSGLTVGMTTSDGISIGGVIVDQGDTTGPRSARIVLSDPLVDVAVLETARGGIVRAGLAYDWSDVGVITNIQPDHIGQDGIESLDDILHIKSLIAERVGEGGTIVLNADDEKLMSLLDNPKITKIKRNHVLFSLNESHILLRKQIAAGNTVYFIRDGWIIETKDGKETQVVRAETLPATFGGAARYNIANAMAAIAAARAQGVEIPVIVSALMSFKHNANNQGRGNLYSVGQGYLMLDYGHNPEAIRAVSEMVCEWSDRSLTCILGLPGDRDNAVLEQSARMVAKCFNQVIVREDRDLRGRKPGELAALITTTINQEAQNLSKSISITEVLNEKEALQKAISSMRPNELIVLFYDELSSVLETLKQVGARPVDALAPVKGRTEAKSA